MASFHAISHPPHSKAAAQQTAPWAQWLVPSLVPITLLPALTTLLPSDKQDAFMYCYAALIGLLCSVAALIVSRRYKGSSRAQWILLSTFFFLCGLEYALALGRLSGIWPPHVQSRVQGGAVSVALFCCYAALTLFRTGEGLPLRILDTIMAALVCILYFFTAYDQSVGPTNFYVRLSAHVILTLAAGGAMVSTRTRFERQFTSIIFRYMLAYTASNFLVNIVNFSWLHSSADFLIYITWGIPEAYFCYMLSSAAIQSSREPTLPIRYPMLQTVTPPMLMLAAVGLALYSFQGHPLFNGVLILLLVGCYAARTHLHCQDLFAERQQLRNRAGHMERLAVHDSLTGIGNRRWMEEVANRHLSAPDFSGASLLLVDVDLFKEVNDTAGHAAGDLVLREVADELCRAAAPVRGASVARMGGDEFAIFLPSVLGEKAFQIAEDARLRVENIKIKQLKQSVTVSIGVSTSTAVTALTFMLELADEALYEAKDIGRNSAVRAREEASLFAAVGHHTTARRFRSLE